MIKQVISTVVLILIGCTSFSIGLISCQTAGKPQTQEAKPVTPAAGAVQERAQGAVVNQGRSIASFLIPDLNADKGLQKTLVDKSNQVLKIWEIVKVTKGAINTIQSSQAAGVDSLSPIDIILGKLSNMLSFAFSLMLFWKILLTISSYMIFLVVIPVCALIIIILMWTYKDRKRVHRLVIKTVLISLVLTFAIPVALQLSALIDSTLLSNNVETLVTAIDAKGRSADNLDRNVTVARRGNTIVNYIGTAKTLGNNLIVDVINFFMIFAFVYFFIPVLFIILIIILTRYVLKLIMSR